MKKVSAGRLAQKHAVYEALSRIGHAISNGKRLRILNLLAQASRSVEELAELTGQSVVTTSAQLKVLRDAGLVVSHREGRHVINELGGDGVLSLWHRLRDVGCERLPEIREIAREHFSDEDAVRDEELDALCAAVSRGELVLLDVRPPREFQDAHLPGARSVPLEELPHRLGELPRQLPVVAYCRGRFCATAFDAVALLREAGFRARLLLSGVPEWRLSGRPVQSGEAAG